MDSTMFDHIPIKGLFVCALIGIAAMAIGGVVTVICGAVWVFHHVHIT